MASTLLLCVMSFTGLAANSDSGSLTFDPRTVLAGKWWFSGNGNPGDLVFQLANNCSNAFTGTVYQQPISGMLDPASKTVSFQRRLNSQDPTPRQEFTGVIAAVPGSSPPRYTLSGTFRALDSPAFGQAGQNYKWTAEATRLKPPAQELEEIQGAWFVSRIIPCRDPAVRLPESARLNETQTQLEFRGNQLMSNGQVVATLTNNLESQALESEKGLKSTRLAVLTLPDGRGVLCSYTLNDSGLEIAYPHTTHDLRGSGQVVFLKRPFNP